MRAHIALVGAVLSVELGYCAPTLAATAYTDATHSNLEDA
jgi:hypothetical protein